MGSDLVFGTWEKARVTVEPSTILISAMGQSLGATSRHIRRAMARRAATAKLAGLFGFTHRSQLYSRTERVGAQYAHV